MTGIVYLMMSAPTHLGVHPILRIPSTYIGGIYQFRKELFTVMFISGCAPLPTNYTVYYHMLFAIEHVHLLITV